jgi:predicted transcriptional regulator
MKTKSLNIRLSDKRLNKLKTIAVAREKTVTQMVEEWIDRLSDKSID